MNHMGSPVPQFLPFAKQLRLGEGRIKMAGKAGRRLIGERAIEAGITSEVEAGTRRAVRSVTVNAAESPLGW
jgi:hypothetical protein